jgi:cytochrome c-type biogenesis protein CcmE
VVVNDDSLGAPSGDAGLDLSPREVDPARSRRGKRKWLPIVVLGLVIASAGVIVTQFLTSAIDYYCNVDEIGTKDGCETGRRLRVQGTVDRGSVVDDGTVTAFSITFNDVSLNVRYEGDPGGIFKECIPVVVHGTLQGDTFAGDRIEVKHSNEYMADNPDRVEDELDSPEGTGCSAPA